MTNINTTFKTKSREIVASNWFNLMILGFIILNGLLIGVQTYDDVPKFVEVLQLSILFVFLIEIILRWNGRKSSQEYWADKWNWFDIFILSIGFIPEIAGLLVTDMNEQQSSAFATLRVLRIIQLTRSIRALEELRILISVLIKSIKSLSYIAVLFLLVMYVYAIIGVTLFKNRDYEHSEHLQLTTSNPDPYGDLGEAFFSLFRIMTGEDWTDLRYNLLQNEYTTKQNQRTNPSEPDHLHTVPGVSNWVVTFYHVSWMVTAAYLLMNLVVGAIVNNFQEVLNARKKEEDDELRQKVDLLIAEHQHPTTK